MKKTVLALIGAATVCLAACATTGGGGPVEGLVDLDAAIQTAASAIEAEIPAGSEISVYKITAPAEAVGDFLADELNARLSRGSLIALAREASLRAAGVEQEFQMSGLVDDASAVGIGHYLGAKVVVSGEFTRYTNFSQLRFRAVEVETSRIIAVPSFRLRNNDPVLAGLTAPLESTKVHAVSEEALAHLNRGKDLISERKYEGAIGAFDRALALDKKLVDAYLYRGQLYYYFSHDQNRAITDFTRAIRLDPDNAELYFSRGLAYGQKNNETRAIADYTRAIRLDPDNTDIYVMRALSYAMKGDYDRAIADYTQLIGINPDDAILYSLRGSYYKDKKDYDRAIADYTQALKIDPNDASTYSRRADAYKDKKDYDRAIADYTQALKIDPNNASTYYNRGVAYYIKGDYTHARADFTKALQIVPSHASARYFLNALGDRGK